MVGDRYELIRQIASGGMATVWLARDEMLDLEVAVKLAHPHVAEDPVARGRFTSEAELTAQLSHPGIVSVFDAGEHEGRPYLVMEYVPGPTLRQELKRVGRFDPDTAARICGWVADALDHAHQRGVLHRDIKPSNIILEEETGRAVLVDFGIASSWALSERVTSDGSVVGTLDYLPPERGFGEAGTAASDVYSLGMVLYELVTGSRPYQAKTPVEMALAVQFEEPAAPSSLAPVPAELEWVILQAIAKDPAQRQQAAAELSADLEAFLAGASPTAVLAERSRSTVSSPSLPASRVRHPFGALTGAAYAIGGSLSTLLAVHLLS